MEKDSMVARESFSSDDSSSLCSVDLGLGFGRKPGGLPKADDSISGDYLELFSLFHDPPSPTIEHIENGEVLEKDDQGPKWRNCLKESVEHLKEKGGLSRISSWSLPKRSFSLKLRNRTGSESTAKNEDKVTCMKEKARGLRRINSAKGKLENNVQV